MEPLTIEAIRRHPEILDALQAGARTARSERVHRLLAGLVEKFRQRRRLALRTAHCG
jgi:hypothetical protein